jgi:dipeptidyl aminopeptidase/acylaminoacyl peptidase
MENMMVLKNAVLVTTLLAGLLAIPLAAQAAAKVPLAAFVQEDQFSKPRLSPDGKHIAITVRLPSGDRFVPVVMFYSLPDMKQVGAVRMPVFELPLDYRWVSNKRLVITKGKELGSREQPVATGEVLATDLDGSKQEYLFGYNMFKASKKGDRYGDDYAYGEIEALPKVLNEHFYLSSHIWSGGHSMLYDIDSANANRKLMADIPAKYMDFVIQNDGKARFASGTGDDGYALKYRYNDASNEWEKMTATGARRYAPFTFLPGDKSFLALYSEKGGPDELIEEDLESGKRKVLFADKVASASELQYGAKRDVPFAVITRVGMPRVTYFDAASEDTKLHKTLSASFPDAVVHFINFTEDGETLLFSVVSDRDPGSYYLFHRSTGKADMLFPAMSAIEPDDMRKQTPITFKARDGLALHGFLTMPELAAGAKAPLVIMPHGGPHGIADTWYFDTDAQFLASRGYAVLQVNFRGSGERGVGFEHAGYRQWGAKIQDDLLDGVKWAIEQGQVDGKRVCSYGASFGGYSALMLAARDPELIKCAVGYAGIYDLEMLLTSERARQSKAGASTIARYVGNDKAELARFSPARQAEKIVAPVLLIHGGKDKIAPIEHAEAMREALVKSGHPPEWLYAANEGHGFYDTINRTKVYESLAAFLDKHIGH